MLKLISIYLKISHILRSTQASFFYLLDKIRQTQMCLKLFLKHNLVIKVIKLINFFGEKSYVIIIKCFSLVSNVF